MALKAVLDSLDGVADLIKSEYVERDGKFHLDVTPVEGFALENTSGLKSALQKERSARLKATERLGILGEVDPERIKEAVEKLEEISGWDPEKKVSEAVKAREAQIVELHKKELGKVSGRSEKLQRQLERVLVDQAAERAIIDAKGNVKLLLPHVKASLRVREDGDVFSAEVVNENGESRIGGNNGSPMTIPQLIEELKQSADFQTAFAGSGHSGGGTTASAGNARSGGSRHVSRNDLQRGGVSPEDLVSGKVQIAD